MKRENETIMLGEFNPEERLKLARGESIAVDVTVQNVEILRKRVTAAESLLAEWESTFGEPSKSGNLGQVTRDFLASQQGEQHTCKNCLGVDPESCMFKHPEQAEGAQGEREESSVTILPDGSAFGVLSFPLPTDHWLYAEREYDGDSIEPKELLAPILNHAEHREAVVSAARYAVRSATMCGKESDFDPDALVQNMVYAMCGPFGGAALAQTSPAPELDYAHMSKRMLEELAKRGKCLVATADLERLTQERDAAQARVAELEQALRHLLHNIKASGKRIDLGLAKECAEDALSRADSAQAGQVPEALREGFMTSCSGNGKYEVKIQFSNLPAAQESHNFLVKLLAAAPAQGE